MSSVVHSRTADLPPNVTQEISFCAIILALLPDDGIQFQTSFAKRSVFFLKCFECCILFLNCLLNSRVDSLNFHFVLFVDVVQFVFDLVASLVFQIVLFSSELFAELENTILIEFSVRKVCSV